MASHDDIPREVLPIPDRKPVGLTTYDAKDPDTKSRHGETVAVATRAQSHGPRIRPISIGCQPLLAANSHLRVPVDVDRELADVLDHGLEICVRHLRQVELGAVVQLDFLFSQHAG
jgi:hypothetical protein